MALTEGIDAERLPNWLAWYFRYGIDQSDTKKRRQQQMARLIQSATGTLSFSYFVFFLAIGPGFELLAFTAFLQGVSSKPIMH